MNTVAVARNEARLEFPEVMNLNQLAAYFQLSPQTLYLSPSGLDLLMRETKEAAGRAGYRPEEVDRLIEKVRAETGR